MEGGGIIAGITSEVVNAVWSFVAETILFIWPVYANGRTLNEMADDGCINFEIERELLECKRAPSHFEYGLFGVRVILVLSCFVVGCIGWQWCLWFL